MLDSKLPDKLEIGKDNLLLVLILVVIFLIFFISVALCIRLILYRAAQQQQRGPKRRSFEGTPYSAVHTTLSKEQGEAMFDLRDYRTRIQNLQSPTRSRDGEVLDEGRFNAVLVDSYYQMLKWAARLEGFCRFR
ncbi:hypothetical protein M3Y99_00836300 [Aphelenchoides fujianensis]|nr:hypothetical protein M3Y99_00836300 [Aphelenchoides fujianensis]